jgi:hypothetical protein
LEEALDVILIQIEGFEDRLNQPIGQGNAACELLREEAEAQIPKLEAEVQQKLLILKHAYAKKRALIGTSFKGRGAAARLLKKEKPPSDHE